MLIRRVWACFRVCGACVCKGKNSHLCAKRVQMAGFYMRGSVCRAARQSGLSQGLAAGMFARFACSLWMFP